MRSIEDIIYDWVKTGDNKELLKLLISIDKDKFTNLLLDPKDFFAIVVSMQDPLVLWYLARFIKDNPEVIKSWNFDDIIYISKIFGHPAFMDPTKQKVTSDSFKKSLITQTIIAELIALYVKNYFESLVDNPVEKDRAFMEIFSKIQNSKLSIVINGFICQGLRLLKGKREDLQYFLDVAPKRRRDGSKYIPLNYHTQFYVDYIERDTYFSIISKFTKDFDQTILRIIDCQNMQKFFINLIITEESAHLLEFVRGTAGHFYKNIKFERLSSISSLHTKEQVELVGGTLLEIFPDVVDDIFLLTKEFEKFCLTKDELKLTK